MPLPVSTLKWVVFVHFTLTALATIGPWPNGYIFVQVRKEQQAGKKTRLLKFRKQMRSGNLLVFLSLNGPFDGIVSWSLCSFVWIPPENMGWLKKKLTIKVKKKCTEEWRLPRKELKIWYMCNNIMVNIFQKKNIFLMLFPKADMVILMSNFDNFDID